MGTEFAGVAAVPLILGLVELVKRAGLSGAWAPVVAVLVGVGLSVGWQWSSMSPAAEAWFRAAVGGIALGLSASGLYSGSKRAIEELVGGI